MKIEECQNIQDLWQWFLDNCEGEEFQRNAWVAVKFAYEIGEKNANEKRGQ